VQQQSVLLLATRGPDGAQKYHPCKNVQRAYRATVLVAARFGRMIEYGEHVDDFMSLRSFAGNLAWETEVDDFYKNLDNIPHHFIMKLLHATEILGYMHPDERFRERWLAFYLRGVHELHLSPESELQLRMRLSDWRREHWLDETPVQTEEEPKGVSGLKDALVSYIATVNSDDRTQNGPELDEAGTDSPEKIFDPDCTACGCGYKNCAHPRPQGMAHNQRKLCDGRVITLAL